MKSLTAILLIATAIWVSSCNSQQQKSAVPSQSLDTFALLQKGDSISAQVQKVLLSNVMQAIKSGGPEYATIFCNEHAMPLTDSLSKANNCIIQRVSDKYRNPANKLTENDEEIWKEISKSNPSNPILVAENGQKIFYKPIKIGMAACLACHGTVGKEVDEKTAVIINQKYPDDLAKGYQNGDIRGLWKITFSGN